MNKLNLQHKEMKGWNEVMNKKIQIKRILDYSLQTLWKVKNEVLAKLSELECVINESFVNKLSEHQFSNLMNALEINRHHSLLNAGYMWKLQ